jgi:hypothetical protein
MAGIMRFHARYFVMFLAVAGCTVGTDLDATCEGGNCASRADDDDVDHSKDNTDVSSIPAHLRELFVRSQEEFAAAVCGKPLIGHLCPKYNKQNPNLTSLTKIASLADICPPADGTHLCHLARRAEGATGNAAIGAYRELQYAIRDAVRATAGIDSERQKVIQAPVVRWFLRERTVALFVYNVITEGGNPITKYGVKPAAAQQNAAGADYATLADRVLKEHYPAYDPSSFRMAHFRIEPSPAERAGSCSTQEALLFYAGVIRLGKREEFKEMLEGVDGNLEVALNAKLPCLKTIRVNTGSFIDPRINAQAGFKEIAKLAANMKLHFLGYSQGATNSLTTLVDALLQNYEKLRTIPHRTQTVVEMNSAAHGSEVGDFMLKFILGFQDVDALCDKLPKFLRAKCHENINKQLKAVSRLKAIEKSVIPFAEAFGIPTGLDKNLPLSKFLEDENLTLKEDTVAGFLESRVEGVRSLTTAAAQAFWANRAKDLPKHTVYFTFRSIIQDTKQDLPLSNDIFHRIIWSANKKGGYNDMQVMGIHHELGGPIAQSEVLGPVAEGNHWSWQVAVGGVPPTAMSVAMTERCPRPQMLTAHYQAMHDVGLVLNGI